MIQSTSKQIKLLAKAVSTAFVSANISPEESNQTVLKFNDLPWSCPPLLCDLELAGVPLQYYFDSPMAIDTDDLLNFWKSTLHSLYLRKRHLIQGGTYQALRRIASRTSIGQKSFRFSIPSGYPHEMPETTGIEFSLEVAHTALISVPVKKHVSDESNYYIVTPQNEIIGVKDGVPAIDCSWDISANGLIQEMLTIPRGHSDYTCLYDPIARSRSLLHEYRKRFKEFEAVDCALQALRKFTYGGACPALLQETQSAPIDSLVLKARAQAIEQSLEVMQLNNVSDRVKIRSIEQLLVSVVMPRTQFRAKLYDIDKVVPLMISDKAIAKIILWLETYYLEKIPENLRRT